MSHFTLIWALVLKSTCGKLALKLICICLCDSVAVGPTPWVTSCPRWVKTGPTRGSHGSTTKSASECLITLWVKYFIFIFVQHFLNLNYSARLSTSSVCVTGMDINSCTARRGPSAWLIWREGTCTGSMRGEPCCPWGRCCSAPAVCFLPCTGQTRNHVYKKKCYTGVIRNSYVWPWSHMKSSIWSTTRGWNKMCCSLSIPHWMDKEK